MSSIPTPVDPEVAAATFGAHMADFFANGRPARDPAWAWLPINSLQAVVTVPALREDGRIDPYFVLLGAHCYDLWPPSVAFVEPSPTATWVQASATSLWWPRLSGNPPFPFALHNPYPFQDGPRQLVCFSHSLDYYLSGHAPTPEEHWQQGKHTVSATLSRIADVLRTPGCYLGRIGDNDS